MALSRNLNRQHKKALGLEVEIVNTEVIFGGSFAGMFTISAATATSRGRGDVYNDAEGMFFLGGWYNQDVTGDTTASPTIKSRTHIVGAVLENVTVVNGVGDRTDNLLPVYLTDDDILDFTRPTLGAAVGFPVKHLTGTSYDIQLMSAMDHWLHTMAGSGQYTWHLGSFDLTVAGSGNLATGIQIAHHANITDFYAIVDVATAVTAMDVDLNLEIGGTSITGGVISITGINARGVKISGTAITALNTVHEGDLLDIEMVVNSSPSAGRVNLYAEVQLLPGL